MLFSVGHSTLPEEKFVHLLRRHDIDTLLDIRSHPTSRWPQFHRSAMQDYLPAAGIKYEFEPRLGGWAGRHAKWAPLMASYDVDISPYLNGFFPKQAIVGNRGAPGDKPTITNVGLHSYSYFLALPEAMDATEGLIARGHTENVAAMCAEGYWVRCHRSLVADYLVYCGADIRHIAGRRMHSEVISDRLDRFDDVVKQAWESGGWKCQ